MMLTFDKFNAKILAVQSDNATELRSTLNK